MNDTGTNSESDVALAERLAKINEKQAYLDKRSAELDKRLSMLKSVLDSDSAKVLNKDDDLVANYAASFNSDSSTVDTAALVPTVMVRILSDGKLYGPVRALLDSGAQPNLLPYNLAQAFRVSVLPAARRVIGIEGNPFNVRKRAMVKIVPWFESNVCIEEEFWVLPKESNWKVTTPHTDLRPIVNTGGMKLADPKYWKRGETVILLGIKFFAKIVSRIIPLPRDIDNLVFMETVFGLVIFGAHTLNLDSETGDIMSTVQCIDSLEELDRIVRRFWKMDLIEERPSRSTEEEEVERNFLNTFERDNEGRFIVTIPLKLGASDIGSSREIALKRFMFLERKLERDPELKSQYVEFMREYRRLGHMRKVTQEAKAGEIVYHIPHHCVTKKFRVVFDASCRTNKGISLNEMQQLGEKLQRDLFEIVMRFRRHRIAFSADIKMMFRQVRIAEEQWNLQRIFWRESPKERLDEYWLTVVTYGMTSSAHNAVRAVIECGRQAAEYFPDAARVIENDLYMDDCVSGSDEQKETFLLARSVEEVLKTGGFELRKWKSNDKWLANRLGTAGESTMIFDSEEQTSVLGLQWLIDSDQFTFVVKTLEIAEIVTKRGMLSCVAQLYDPNGYIAPVIVLGKVMLQDIWRIGTDWDQEVPAAVKERWIAFWADIARLENFRIDRWIGTRSDAKIQIHGFSDASTTAYGAVIYVRVQQVDGKVTCSLLVSKSRVAPLKTITIPRLELLAADVLGYMVAEVKRSMEWPTAEYVLWTDSAVVLCWLQKIPRDMKTFVGNRVSSIQTNTDVRRWRHVGTKDNPADLLSRGLMPAEIVGNSFWLHGPKWLTRPESDWPASLLERGMPAGAPEEMQVFAMMEQRASLYIYSPAEKGKVPLLEYISSLERLVSILAHILHYMNRLQAKPALKRREKRGELNLLTLTVNEKGAAMHYLIRSAQEESYKMDIAALRGRGELSVDSKIESLRPIFGNGGLLRVGGRLERADISYEQRHPPIIPNGSRLAWLIIDSAHRMTKHGSVQDMMRFIRQRFWIPRLRSECRNFLHKCVICARYNYRLEQQLMSDLPGDRVRAGKPFLHSGVDYAGPFEVKVLDRDGSQLTKCKAWVAIFVCLKTRAVHIDLVTDLTSVSFIACYERFIGRRGRCERIYSDNGTSFVGAAKEIRKAMEEWRRNDAFAHINMKGTEWKFMVPAAPHQGGIYEAAVKSMKYHLVRIVGQRVLTHEQLTTLLVQIEAVLNSRPIHPLSDDPDDVQALTPGHFLVGEPMILPPPFEMAEQSTSNGMRLWKERERMLTHFWKRWHEEYLVTLQERKKWRKEKESMKVGQLVLIKSENFPPAQWALGRIRELIVSRDGLVRSVVVQTETGQLKRPVQKICVVPLDTTGPDG